MRMIVVGQPAYLHRHPPPQTPAELEAHNRVNDRLVTGGGTFSWTLTRDATEVRLRATGQLILDDPDLAVTMAVDGAGLGLVLEEKAAPHLAAGRLRHLLDGWCVPFEGWHLYYPSRHVSPALRALIDVVGRPGTDAKPVAARP